MNYIFGTQKTNNSKEFARTQKKQLNQNGRQMEKEILQLDREEQKVIQQIKQASKQGRHSEAKLLAKQVVNIRKQKERLVGMKGKLNVMSHKTSQINAQNTLMSAVKNSAQVMGNMNKQQDVKAMQSIMSEFQKQNQMSNMSEEMIDSTLDDIFDEEEVEEGMQDAMDEIYDEIGLDISQKMKSTPANSLPTSQIKSKNSSRIADDDNVEIDEDEDELIKRLTQLKE